MKFSACPAGLVLYKFTIGSSVTNICARTIDPPPLPHVSRKFNSGQRTFACIGKLQVVSSENVSNVFIFINTLLSKLYDWDSIMIVLVLRFAAEYPF